MATWDEPLNNGIPVEISRRACFGTFNSFQNSTSERLEVMEWHPEDDTRHQGAYNKARECYNFISSLGPWKDVFRLTSVNGIAADIRNLPADQIITGFMAARNHNFGQYDALANRREVSSDRKEEAKRLMFVGYCAGASVGSFGFNWSPVENGEGGMCRLYPEDDAYGLYLLAYGSKEECQNLFLQNPLFSSGANSSGYLRDRSSNTIRRLALIKGAPDDFLSGRDPSNQHRVTSMADWLRVYLKTGDAAETGKLGRLTVGQFIGRHEQRNNSIDAYFNMFEELKDLYS